MSNADTTQPAAAATSAANPATTTAVATTTPAATTATATPYAQWGTAHIPIDPALQQTSASVTPYAHYQAYSPHYHQATYQHYYAQQQHQQTVAAQQAQTAAAARTVITPATAPATANTTTAASTGSTANQSGGSGGVDTTDLATLNDALGSAGVDLKAEEESLQRSYEHHQSYRPFEDRTRKQPPTPSFDTRFLSPTIRSIASQHKITKIPDDSLNYLALALRARLQDLVTEMIRASHHRTDTQFDRPASFYREDGATPMWSLIVRSDVGKQLAALEKVEREEEYKVRRERKERTELAAAHAAALASQSGAGGAGGGAMNIDGYDGEDGSGGQTKKKRKKEGPGVTARNMSEDVRKKMSNAVATQAAGLGGKYAWMNSSNAAAAAKPKPAVATAASAAAGSAGGAVGTSATTSAPAGSSSWARPYVANKKAPTATEQQAVEEDTRIVVTLRDAMFVIEKEKGHGGGRGAARGWV